MRGRGRAQLKINWQTEKINRNTYNIRTYRGSCLHDMSPDHLLPFFPQLTDIFTGTQIYHMPREEKLYNTPISATLDKFLFLFLHFPRKNHPSNVQPAFRPLKKSHQPTVLQQKKFRENKLEISST